MDQNESAVRKVLEGYSAAVYAKDVTALAMLYDEDVGIFDMWDAWSMQGIAAWRKMAEGWFGGLGDERVRVEFEDVQVTATATLGYASAIAKYSAISAEGKVLRWLQNRFSIVVAPKGGAWKIIHEHTSGPADSNTQKISMQR